MGFKIEDDAGNIGQGVRELPVGSEYLIAWVSMGLGESPDINIYGNPEGLRRLANKLIEIADLDQTTGEFPDTDSFHKHFATGCNTESKLPRLTIGRVDSKNEPQKLRDCFPHRVPEFSDDKCMM